MDSRRAGEYIGGVRGVAVVLLAAGALPLAVPAGAPAQPAVAKAFASGCWKGKGKGNIIGVSSPTPGITINIDTNAYTFVLHVTKKVAAGKLNMKGHGTGVVSASGVTATADITVTGNLGLSGTPSKVSIKGQTNVQGSVSVAGTTVPINFSGPVNGVPLKIKSVTPTKATGTAGKSTWTAARVGKTCP
jgi:hypothetical protein